MEKEYVNEPLYIIQNSAPGFSSKHFRINHVTLVLDNSYNTKLWINFREKLFSLYFKIKISSVLFLKVVLGEKSVKLCTF